MGKISDPCKFKIPDIEDDFSDWVTKDTGKYMKVEIGYTGLGSEPGIFPVHPDQSMTAAYYRYRQQWHRASLYPSAGKVSQGENVHPEQYKQGDRFFNLYPLYA
jgi:hypothetical protein